jgi:hypothetical protein
MVPWILQVEIVVCAIAAEPMTAKHSATTANRSKPPNLKKGVIVDLPAQN